MKGRCRGKRKTCKGLAGSEGRDSVPVKDFWIGYIPGIVVGAILITLYKIGVFG